MSLSDQKVVQYLNEAHASELALVSVLKSQIAMTPDGSYGDVLEQHLDETRTHAGRIQERLEELGQARNPFQAVLGLTETVAGQMLALSKAPFDLLRGSSGEERVLKNAKDACASEQLEIATYTALERLASKVGDDQTAKLAASIRREEERMLKRVLTEIPKLTDAVVRAEIESRPSSGMTETGPAHATRKAARRPRRTARQPQDHAKRPGRQARKSSGGGQVERPKKRSTVSGEQLPIPRYRSRSAEEILSELSELSESDLGKIEVYERKNSNRRAITSRIRVLGGEEPWPGYDELTVAEIEAVLNEGDYHRAQDVFVYEKAHKNRPEVIQSAIVPARFVLSNQTR